MKKPRITARIRNGSGLEKTVSFRCNTDEIEKTLRIFFHATSYIVYSIGNVKFYHDRDFTEIK